MVKKEIPDAEEFVFTGNFKCVSMSREVMRTAAHTNSNHTHTRNLLLHHPKHTAQAFLGFCGSSFLYFRAQSIYLVWIK